MKTLSRLLCFAALLALLAVNVYIELKAGADGRHCSEAGVCLCVHGAVVAGLLFVPGREPCAAAGLFPRVVRLLYLDAAEPAVFDAAFGRGVGVGGGLNTTPLLTIRNYLRAYELGNISLKWVLVNLAGNLAAFCANGLFPACALSKAAEFLCVCPDGCRDGSGRRNTAIFDPHGQL